MDRFAENRARLAAQLGSEGIALVPAGSETVRNHDVHHEFRQDSDFFYLTGFEEPDAVAVLVPGHPDGDFHLFVRPRDPEAETWTGVRAGVEGAMSRYGADAAYPIDRLDQVLSRLMVGREVLYYRIGDPRHDRRVASLIEKARSYRDRMGKPAPAAVRDLHDLLGRMRLRKSGSEIESLRAACELSAEGHREAMRFCRPGLYEYQVQAAMEYVWREGGSRRNGYPSIVASGPNTVILHYTDNDRQIEDGDLVLIDAGCEIDYYTADITRTFPASGKFTPPQRAVYEAVLEAQREAIRVARPGVGIREVHDRAVEVLCGAMVELGLLPLGVEESLAMHHYRAFFMHGTSHWLGVDVHDAGPYRVDGRPTCLEPGMVFTVEPGIYVPADRTEVEFRLLEYDLDAWLERRLLEGLEAAKAKEREELERAEKLVHTIPEELVGVGIRIEDDVLVTESGVEILTRTVPVEPDRVEALCGEASWLTRS
ncbi:MAG: Xaa-Pro aminopeptidase [Acidimicrobiia bacterium]|nr:MAG: Xaa-Pro aminopeptidase [Acidimicrobiia bacterium]